MNQEDEQLLEDEEAFAYAMRQLPRPTENTYNQAKRDGMTFDPSRRTPKRRGSHKKGNR